MGDIQEVDSGFEVPLTVPMVHTTEQTAEPRAEGVKRGPYKPRELDGGSDGRGRMTGRLPEVTEELRRAEAERKEARKVRLAERGLVQRGRGAKGTGRPRRVRRHAARIALLPADRKCPRCGDIKLESRKWVAAPNGEMMCLGCWRKCKNENTTAGDGK